VGDHDRREVDAYANPYNPNHARYVLDSAGYREGLRVLLAVPETDWMPADLPR
jgi:hypothetical protein